MDLHDTGDSINPHPLANSDRQQRPNTVPPALEDGRPKVLIPRDTTVRPVPRRKRTKRACEECRQRRSKCDGRKPICENCEKRGITDCVYLDSKKIQVNRELESLRSTVGEYRNLLYELLHEVPNGTAKKIKVALMQDDLSSRNGSSNSSTESSPDSLRGIDTVSEDFNRNQESRATGFVGKNSVISWLRGLDLHSAPRSPGDRESASTVSYFLDDHQITNPAVVDAWTLPPKSLADRLLHSYFEYVHSHFPIVRRKLFLEQYRSFAANGSARPGTKWLAILNLIFAIGYRHLRFLQVSLQHDINDEAFFSRACLLNVIGSQPYEHADLQQIQVDTLVALYFLVSSQINRAWKVSGVAVRSAMALGINLRGINGELHHFSREARCRLWWSMYLVENLLSQMTGRPNCIVSSAFSAHPPIPIEEEFWDSPEAVGLSQDESVRKERLTWSLDDDREALNIQSGWLKGLQPNKSLHFYYLIDLVIIAHTAIEDVYLPKAVQSGKSYVKRRIQFYDEKMDNWLSRIHPAFSFLDSHSNLRLHWSCQEQVILAFYYFSARISLYRPCIPHQKWSALKEKENSSLTTRCLRAALGIISVFPDEVDLRWVYQISPWWCVLHFLMQATTVLTIYIRKERDADATADGAAEVEPVGNPKARDIEAEEFSKVHQACKKAYTWLYSLSKVDESSRRAFQLYDDLAQRIGLDIKYPPSDSEKISGGKTQHGSFTATASLSRHQEKNDKHRMTDVPEWYQRHMGPELVGGQFHSSTNPGTSFLPGHDQEMLDDSRDATNSLDWEAVGFLADPESSQQSAPTMSRDFMTENYSQWLSAALVGPEAPPEAEQLIDGQPKPAQDAALNAYVNKFSNKWVHRFN